jgi:hypothetical protein
MVDKDCDSPMSIHGNLADAELATNLLVQPPADHQRHDLSFATAERRVPIPNRPYLPLATH